MTDDIRKTLEKDPDGLLTYEYIANHIETVEPDIDYLIENMLRVDRNGQFLVSTARYLNAIDKTAFADAIRKLVADAIERDREHKYIGNLLPDLYGTDYHIHAEELSVADDNFRRIYKRVFPKGF